MHHKSAQWSRRRRFRQSSRWLAGMQRALDRSTAMLEEVRAEKRQQHQEQQQEQQSTKPNNHKET